MSSFNIKNINIPQSPGCYLYYDENGKLLYIGKAANLRSRVFSYWRESANHTPAKAAMVSEIKSVDFITTDSEIEAFLLEANLIKKYQPPYNIDLRDDKRHSYVKISTEDKWPRVFLTRKIDKSGRYFGPFVSLEPVREVLKIIRRLWPYRSCSTLPKRACLYYRIGKCPGMCEEKISHKDYLDIIKNITLFLEGKKGKIISNFKFQISNLRKKIKIKNISSEEKNKLEQEIKHYEWQINNINQVLSSNRLIGVAEKYANDVVELAKLFNLPKIPQRIEGYDISNIFGRQAVGSMVVFANGEPDKSEYRKFKIKLSEGQADDTKMLTEVLERRFLHSISNFQFPISDQIQNPKLKKNNSNKKFWQLPDLIIIDGGKGQVNAATRVLKKFKFDIPLIGISKGEHLRSAHAPDKIFFPGEKKSLQLPLSSPAIHLAKRVRDEAHRFAIEYHRNLKRRKLFKR